MSAGRRRAGGTTTSRAGTAQRAAPPHGAGHQSTSDPVRGSGAGRRTRRRQAQAAAREAEQARTMRKVRRYGPPAAVLAVLAVVIVAVVVVRGGGSSGDDSAATARTQQTLVIQLVPSAGRPSVGNALTGADSKADAAVFATLPGRLITDAPSIGRTTLDQTTADADKAAAADALADQLDVIVDGSWALTAQGLASLVDGVGGVSVDVDTDVTSSSHGATVVAIPKGTGVRLGGAQAAQLASYLGPDEAEQARLARFTAVWTELLRKLPDDRSSVESLLATDTGSTSTWANDRLAAYLVELHQAVVSDSMAYPTLPTAVVDTGTNVTSYRLDQAKVDAFVKQYFAGSLPQVPPGGAVSVLVQNGVGTPGLAAKARAKLIADGLTFQGGGNAKRFGYQTSVVLIPDSSEQARTHGAAVAKALGLPAASVQQSEQSQSVADVVVILGADFHG